MKRAPGRWTGEVELEVLFVALFVADLPSSEKTRSLVAVLWWMLLKSPS